MSPKTAKKRAVIFDFDGVVADSWQLHEKCWRTVCEKHNYPLPEGALAKTVGLSSAETAEALAAELAADISAKELGEEKSACFRDRAAQELQPMAGAAEALQRLHGEFLIAVAAIRRRGGVLSFLERFDLQRYLDQVVTMDDLTDERNVDELLARTARQLDVTPAKSIVVQDARHGVLAAKRAKMRTIAFNSNPKHDFDFSNADAEVTTLDELVPELINSVAAS